MTTQKGKHRFRALDGWRGIAALTIALLHARLYGHLEGPVMVHSFWLVDFFFVLSGFVIGFTYEAQLLRGRDFLKFCILRVGRLWPLNIFVLLLWVLLLIVPHTIPMLGNTVSLQTALRTLLEHVFLVAHFDVLAMALWNPADWTIGIEMEMYLLFGVACLVLARAFTGAKIVFALVAIAFSAAVLLLQSPLYLKVGIVPWSLARCGLSFFSGYLVYKLWQRWRDTFISGTALEIIACTAMFLYLFYADTAMANMIAPLVFGFAIFVFAFERGFVSRLLLTAPLQRLGAWSYSIYLLHFIVIFTTYRVFSIIGRILFHTKILTDVPARYTDSTVVLVMRSLWVTDIAQVIFAAAVISLASLTYRFVERPGRNLFKKIAAGIPAEKTVATP